MGVKVEIDEASGFCYGVVRAVNQCENYLQYSSRLYSLGSIVHNNAEIERLSQKGLVTIDIEKMAQLRNEVVLIRAHGEPPQTYSLAKENNLQIIDCTCPVVLKLQQKIESVWEEIREHRGQIVIFGKKGHAEVNGLVGQTEGNAIVVETLQDVDCLDFEKPVVLFSQTTKDPIEYESLASEIEHRCLAKFTKYDTICRQVATRHDKLASFARNHSVIVFVCGHESSNGKVLFNLCSGHNPRAYMIERPEMIRRDWFQDGDNVGVCGATSTPMWQLEEVASYIRKNITFAGLN